MDEFCKGQYWRRQYGRGQLEWGQYGWGEYEYERGSMGARGTVWEDQYERSQYGWGMGTVWGDGGASMGGQHAWKLNKKANQCHARTAGASKRKFMKRK